MKQGDDQRDASEGPSRTHYTLCSFCGLIKSSLPPWWPISSLVVSLSLRQSCHSRKGICADVVLRKLIWFLVIRYHSMDPTLQMRQFPRPYECTSPRLSSPCSYMFHHEHILFKATPEQLLVLRLHQARHKRQFRASTSSSASATSHFAVLVTQARHNTQCCAYTYGMGIQSTVKFNFLF